MRKPVRSAVANRKYFQGGGLAPMKPAAPEEAVGIMASSQPLVDMVAQNAGNPQGGMSPLNFDQGGLASVPVPKGRTRSRFGDLDLKLGKAFRDFYTLQGLRNPQGKLNFDLYDVIPGGYGLKTGIQSLFTKDALEKSFSVGQLGAVNLLIRNNPDKDPRKIMETAYKVYNENPNYGTEIDDKLQQAVDQLGKSPEKLALEQTQGEKLLKETEESKDKLKPFLRDPKGGVIKDEKGIKDGLKSKEIPEEDRKKIEEKGGELAKSLLEKEQEQAKKNAEEQAKKDAIVKEQDAVTKLIEEVEGVERDKTEGETVSEETNIINQNVADDQKTSEDRLGMLMKRFTDAAPKYEGLDTGLALMQMGAIMAGGTSPNAIKNIADALTVTSEKLIKDKAKRDEFNRQLNLSALQYGLGEISKEDAQKRKDDRNFITLVASKDGTNPLTGEKISKGESIRVSMTDMLSKDIPSMFKDKDMYVAELDAAVKAKKAVSDLINEQRKELILSDTAAVKQQELYNKASKQYIQSTAGLKFVDNALITLSEGQVTGLKGGANDLTLKVATALGLKVGHKFKDKKEFEDSVKKAFQKLIPTALGGVQSANSISDRDVQFLADAYIESSILKGGTFNLVTVNEDILIGKLQTLRDTFVQNQEAGLSGMRQVNDFLLGRTRPGGGSAQTYISEGQERIRKFREEEIPTVGEIKLEFDREDEDGTKIFKIPGLKSG
jgi:hypothetical protein